MKKKDSRLRIRIFYGILIIPTLLWILLSLIGVAKVLDYDTGEKRNKHEIAEDANLSNITSELESVYSDRVPFRSILLSINSRVNYITEIPYNKVIEPLLLRMANASYSQTGGQTASGSDGAGEGTAGAGGSAAAGSAGGTGSGQEGTSEGLPIDTGSDQTGASDGSDGSTGMNGDSTGDASNVLPILPATYETPNEAGYYPYKEIVPEVIQGRDGWLFTTESYLDFTGGTIPSEETLVSKLSTITQLNDICQSKGIEFHTFIIPNKNTVYPEYMPTLDKVETSALNVLESFITENSSVSFHFLDEEMLGSKIYGQLYYKTDTHWNNRGGLTAYAYMRNFLGFSPIDIASIESVQSDEYYGDLAEYTGLPLASFETDYSVDMAYKCEVTQQVVRGGDDLIDEVVAQNTESDKTVVLIGDSYRHSLLPYLSRDYAHVYSLNGKLVCDEMADILNSADIIILEGVERGVFFETYYDHAVEGMISLMG